MENSFFYKILLSFLIIFLVVNLTKRNYELFGNNQKNVSIRIICLCTKNYDNIGCYGVNSLKYYCDKHNYKFTVYRDKIIKDLHINFSKNAIVLDACKKYKEDYFVCIDTDVAVKDLNFKLESLITPGHILFAPKDFWAGEKKRSSIINAGFTIWKNCKRTQFINRKWIEAARNECKHISNKHPRQQNVFDTCIFKILKKNELKYLDHNLVGMIYSKIICQTKTPKKLWEKIGRPNYNLCKLEE